MTHKFALACGSRYHVGCFQSDWMIGRCAAEGGVLPMVGALSCGLCLTCRTGSHTLRRYALARLRDEKVPPCFGLTTCDHHLPVPLRKELCQLLPQRTPVMHGWGRMCGAVAKEQRVFPSIINKHVSAIRPVSSALRALHVNKPSKLGLLRLGVVQLEDLMDLTLEDLATVGMASKAASRFMHKLWDGGPVRSSIDPGLTNSTTMRDMAALLRMERFKFEFSTLGVRTAVDLLTLTEQQWLGLKLSRVQTRRINSAIRHLGGSGRDALLVTAGVASDLVGGATDSATVMPATGAPAEVSASAVPPYPERCDCAWSHGRHACRGLWDDFTPCWAVCCPMRGPRFGDWRRLAPGQTDRQRNAQSKPRTDTVCADQLDRTHCIL